MKDENKSKQQLIEELAALHQQVAELEEERFGRHEELSTERDITERKRAEAERKRLLAETMGEIFLALTAQTGYKAVLDEILRQAQRVVSYSAANIVMLEDDTMRVVHWQGYRTFGTAELLATLEQSLTNFPLEAQVVQARHPLIIPDTHQNSHWVKVKELAWIRSFVAVPIHLRDHVLGLLRLDSDLPGKFSGRDVERLQPLASAAAIALENVRSYGQARRGFAERIVQAETEIIQLNRNLLILQYAGATIATGSDLQSVLNTVIKEMANLLKVEGCAIFEWDQAAQTVSMMVKYGLDGRWEEGSLLERYLLADFPLIERVLVERRPQQMTAGPPGVYPAESADMQAANLKTLMMVPMEFQDRVVGLVKMMDGRVERTFSNREIGLVQLLANQAASTIQNSRLYDQVQQEIAERVQAEKELRQVAAKNQAILDAIPDSMFYFSRDGQLIDYRVVGMIDLPPEIFEEIIVGSKPGDMLPVQFDSVDLTLPDLIDQTLASGQMQTFEYQLPLPQGIQDFEARLVASGPNEVLAIVRDITQRKQAEAAEELHRQALAEERNLLRTLIDSLPDNIAVKDIESRYVLVNNAYARILGAATRDELIGKTDFDTFPRELAELYYAGEQEIIQSGQPSINREEFAVDHKGRKQWLLTTRVPLRDGLGNITGLVGISHDITERKQAEQALWVSEKKFRTLAEMTAAAIFIYQGTQFRYANPATESMTGYTQTELMAMNFWDVIHPDFRELAKRRGIARQRGEPVPARYELKLLSKTGQERWVDATLGVIEFEGEAAVLGTGFDITTRKQAEQALIESEDRLLAEMQSVLVITRALASEIDLNDLLEFIIIQAEHLTDADGVAVLLLSDDDQQLEVAAPGQSWLQIETGARIPLQGSLAELTIAGQRVQISNRAQDDERAASIRTLLHPAEVHSLLCAPLVVQSRKLGVLLIWSERERGFTSHEDRLVGLFADQAALALHNAHLHARNRQLAVEQERHRLARELHDSVTQSIFSMGLAAETSLRLLGQDADRTVHDAIEYIHTLSQNALAEMREQLYHLHPTVLDEDLVEALARHCHTLSRQYALVIDFKPSLEASPAESQRDALYYITREALWNVVKHANASHVKIVLTSEKDQIVISIEDDGVGFEPPVSARMEMMGLRNMEERAKLLGGAFELQSKPGQGTRISVWIPISLPEK